MRTLAEIQQQFRDAVIHADTEVVPLLIGGSDPVKRLMIHQRNFETSLVDALIGKFPATGWLVGTPFLLQAAGRFVRKHPPQAPCIAEYGVEFPEFLSQCPGAERLPYLGEFAELEWHVGQVAIAIDDARCMHLTWPVDELIKFYLTDAAPDRFELSRIDAWIEVSGGRGEFRFTRLSSGHVDQRNPPVDQHHPGARRHPASTLAAEE